MSEALSDIIKKKRVEKGFTQTDMANFLGIKLRTYQYYEEGRNEPKIPAILLLAQKLDFKIEDVYVQHIKMNYTMMISIIK